MTFKEADNGCHLPNMSQLKYVIGRIEDFGLKDISFEPREEWSVDFANHYEIDRKSVLGFSVILFLNVKGQV